MPTAPQTLKLIIASLEQCITAAETIHMTDTPELLRIARLDCLMQLHQISEEELELLLIAVSNNKNYKDTNRIPQENNMHGAEEAITYKK
jgi:hypothetical protein